MKKRSLLIACALLVLSAILFAAVLLRLRQSPRKTTIPPQRIENEPPQPIARPSDRDEHAAGTPRAIFLPLRRYQSLSDQARVTLISFVLFVLILGAGIAVRLQFAPRYTHMWDQDSFRTWALTINTTGLFSVYTETWTNYPPLSLMLLGGVSALFQAGGGNLSDYYDPGLGEMVKTVSILGDVALIVFAYGIARRLVGERWALIPAAVLAFSPAIIVNSSLWGQNDSLPVCLSVLSIGLLALRRSTLAWAVFALALLAKQQAVVIVPVLVVGTLFPTTPPSTPLFQWRNAWRLVNGVFVGALIWGVVTLPFYLSSGQIALRPFDSFSERTHMLAFNAYNFWHWATGGFAYAVDDGVPYAGTSITPRDVGHLLLGAYLLLIVVTGVLRRHNHSAFLLAGLMGIGFFMLPTQMHERYIYPAIPLLAMAIIGGRGSGIRRIDPLALLLCVGFTLTGTYNQLDVLVTKATLRSDFPFFDELFPGGGYQVAGVNVALMFLGLAWFMWRSYGGIRQNSP